MVRPAVPLLEVVKVVGPLPELDTLLVFRSRPPLVAVMFRPPVAVTSAVSIISPVDPIDVWPLMET